MHDKKFNIRVYGLIIWESKVLVSDEFLWNKAVTKFPGGGLEWGEGIIDCLKREFTEELNIAVFDEKLFYVNGFFQESVYNKNDQIISIYYILHTSDPQGITVQNQAHNHTDLTHGSQVFRWISLKEIKGEMFHFPVDKVVAEKLMVDFARF